MKLIPIVRIISAIALCIYTVSIPAKEVRLNYRGLSLNADLMLATGNIVDQRVILITHGALAHRNMEFLVYLRKLLKDKGYNTLAINLSLGIPNRHGMFDCGNVHRHRNDDARRGRRQHA